MDDDNVVELKKIPTTPIAMKVIENTDNNILYDVQIYIGTQFIESRQAIRSENLNSTKSMLHNKWIHVALKFRQFFDDERQVSQS